LTSNFYSPLAGGILTGKLTGGVNLSGSRLESGNALGAFFRNLYDKPVVHEAITELVALLEPQGLSLPQASIRWLAHHSYLQTGDGIILGASKISQIETSVEDIDKGPLTNEAVEGFEVLWRRVQRGS
jgi:aflatoxin B1 aldehyde reductase